MPFPGPGEKGLCGGLSPSLEWTHSWAEVRPPRLCGAPGLRLEAGFGGLSMGLCTRSQGPSVAELMAPTL